MDRRDFIKQSLSSVATAGVAASLLGASNCLAAPTYDWKLGWKSVENDRFTPVNMEVHGDIPEAISGVYFRNGPAKLERDDVRYHHWFDGDGMVQKFTFNNGQVTHSGQYVHTLKYKQEEQAQRFLYNGAGSVIENSLPTRNNDSINTANTALQVWDGELLALWEGGSAYSLNPDTLTTSGLKTWHEGLANMPFSAHPLTDTYGNMWNYGFAPYAGKTGKIVIYHIAPKTGLKKSHIVDLPFRGYMHDFAQTSESLVFLVPPYTFTNAAGRTFVDKFEWQANLGSRLLVVNKSDLSKQKWFELPAGFVFHFGHATEQNGNLQVNMCWYEDAELMETGMTELMSSGSQTQNSLACAATVVANLHSGQAKIVKSTTNLEFPGFNSESLKQDTTIYGVNQSSQAASHADTLMAWSPYQGEVDTYRYPQGVMIEEPILVTANELNDLDSNHPGYILQTYLDVGKQKKSGLNIFEANNLKAGPIAQANMSRTLPLGFHGTFMPS
jgi:all-trans-8'-apo-beta-carotenal 15,15'-oxygenase